MNVSMIRVPAGVERTWLRSPGEDPPFRPGKGERPGSERCRAAVLWKGDPYPLRLRVRAFPRRWGS